METKLVCQLPPKKNNPRNSEGAFIRAKNGDILFAYSRYTGDSTHDHAACDIALIRSSDEGESWSEPEVIAKAEFFGTKNIMSVSALTQNNGDIGFYFLIKENDFTTTLGRAISSDGESFVCERCRSDFEPRYYVVNNDRLIRLQNGTIIAPAAFITAEENIRNTENHEHYPYKTTLLYSIDDGKSFKSVGWSYTIYNENSNTPARGLQEPGIIERLDGSLYLWMRTGVGCQFESESNKDIESFSEPTWSAFTAPDSPMQIKEYDGVYYSIYNPVPNYNGRVNKKGTWGRTPFVIRKSEDGRTYGEFNIIEDADDRGYCYPAIFKTNDGALLVGYCRGGAEDGNTLCRLGISKIAIDTIK